MLIKTPVSFHVTKLFSAIVYLGSAVYRAISLLLCANELAKAFFVKLGVFQMGLRKIDLKQ